MLGTIMPITPPTTVSTKKPAMIATTRSGGRSAREAFKT
jgi:hypothetical protein